MMYSLWRNGELLGELEVRPHPRDPEQISGILRPTPALTERETISQTRPRVPARFRAQLRMPEVIQLRKPARVLGEYGKRGDRSDGSSPFFSVEIRHGEAQRPSPDVLPEERFEVRSADGSLVDADLFLHCWIVPESDAMRAEILRQHGTLGDGHYMWSFILKP